MKDNPIKNTPKLPAKAINIIQDAAMSDRVSWIQVLRAGNVVDSASDALPAKNSKFSLTYVATRSHPLRCISC